MHPYTAFIPTHYHNAFTRQSHTCLHSHQKRKLSNPGNLAPTPLQLGSRQKPTASKQKWMSSSSTAVSYVISFRSQTNIYNNSVFSHEPNRSNSTYKFQDQTKIPSSSTPTFRVSESKQGSLNTCAKIQTAKARPISAQTGPSLTACTQTRAVFCIRRHVTSDTSHIKSQLKPRVR